LTFGRAVRRSGEVKSANEVCARKDTALSSGGNGPIIIVVNQTPLSLDTSPEVERQQVESWRRMSAVQKAAMVTGLTSAAFAMTWAGVRHRYPDASPREHFLHVAVIVLGPELARRAYPDAKGVIAR
jgi:hypothetical protein